MARARFGRTFRSFGMAATALAAMLLVSALPVGQAAAAGADDAAVAQELVGAVQQAAAKQPEVARAVASALAQVAQALERGRRMRAVGDEAHARTADGLAREWAETARDVARAVDTEAHAAELRRKAVDSQAQLERTHALVEEGIAHVGRLQTEVDKAEAAGTTRTAVERHDGAPAPAHPGTAGAAGTPGTRVAPGPSRRPAAAGAAPGADAGANVESIP